MNRFTVFADIAGQRARSVTANPRVTAAAVVLPTAELDALRGDLPGNIGKWKDATEASARQAVAYISHHAIAAAAATVNRDTPAWRKALVDSDVLHQAIATQSRAKAGWAKLPMVHTYELLTQVCIVGLCNALIQLRGRHVLNSAGTAEIECNIVCDEEFSGQENVETFVSFWSEDRLPRRRLTSMGYRVSHPSVLLKSEQDEKLLLLPDIIAGLVHSAHIQDPGRLPLPLSASVSVGILQPMVSSRRLVVEASDYDTSFDQVFGDVMNEARRQSDG